MFRSKLLAHAAVTLTVVAFAPLPAAAAAPQGAGEVVQDRDQEDDRRGGVRMGRGRTLDHSAEVRTEEQAADALAEAVAVAQTAGLACQPTEAFNRGTIEETGVTVYELACATGPGYLISTTTPPETFNCISLKQRADTMRAEDPEAVVGAECQVERNLDPMLAIQPYVASIASSCQIDQVSWLGQPATDSHRYEIGCAGTSGYWVEAPLNSMTPSRVLGCAEVVGAGATCRFTTAEEIAATVAAIAATGGRTCQVTNARYAGRAGENSVYEAACADGQGYMFLSSAEGQVTQSWDCVDAAHLGGGCRLTDAAVIRAAANEVEQARLTNAGLSCQYQAHRQIGADNRGRTVLEYQCADKPLGLVAFVGETTADSEGMDCIASELLSVRCSLTTRDTVAEALTRMMTAGGESCTVTDYAVLSPAARASRGEAVELKCADGGGYIAEIPFARDRVGLTRSCAAAREYGEACTL